MSWRSAILRKSVTIRRKIAFESKWNPVKVIRQLDNISPRTRTLVTWYCCLGYQPPGDKYAAEEKAVVDDEIAKTVTERRMEIEQRLTGEPLVIEKKQEPSVGDDTVPVVASKPADVPTEPIEPTEVSFEHKRMSFERGVSIEQVLQDDIPVKEKSILSEEKKMSSIEENKSVDVDVDVDATSLTFHEKRLSFEQGIPVKEIIQKKTEEIVPEYAEYSTDELEKQSQSINETEILITRKDTASIEGKHFRRMVLNLHKAIIFYR